jgi:hypothetical protein
MKILQWRALLFCICISCEKAINFTPNNREPRLVVEATIENGHPPVAYLSRSLDFFSSISPDKLAGSFVRNARVIISDGTKTDTLKEFKVPLTPDGGYFLYYYSTDSSGQSASIKGEEGGKYSMIIQVDNKEYTASTSIPHLTKSIDSLYFEEGIDEKDSSKVVLYGKFNDPPGFGNYSRYFTKVNSGPYLPGLNSVYDDQVIDGKTYNVQIEKGVDRNTTIDLKEYSFFHKGDTISIKFCNIDKAVFDFWRTMEYTYSSIGNPFSSPTKVIGNISNGGLGYFGGYAVQYASIIIPE